MNENHKVIEQYVGFSKDESNEYLINVLEKLYGSEYSIDNELLENIYQLTNGNGYHLSKFVYSQKGDNYQEKLKMFIKDMTLILEAQLHDFFGKRVTKGKVMWLIDFPELISYLDVGNTFPNRLFEKHDKNLTYIENSKLKSVNNFAKEVFIHYYRKMIIHFKKTCYFLDIGHNEGDSVLIGIERYVIQTFLRKFVMNDKDDEFYNYTLQNKVSEKIQCQIFKENFVLSFSNDDIEDIMKFKKNSYLIKPAKFNNPLFDFIIWDAKKEFLYVFQVITNAKNSSADQTFFTEKEYYFLSKSENVRFIWIGNEPKFRSKYKNKSIGYLSMMF